MVQLQLFVPRKDSLRDMCLTAIDLQSDWLTGKEIARLAGVRYAQAVFALAALHEQGKIAKKGRKRSVRWGRRSLGPPAPDMLVNLHGLFFVRPPSGSD